MWFANAHAVSNGVRCYPNPHPLNKYRVLSPIKDLKVNLFVPYSRVVLAGYQLPIYSSSNKWFSVRLHKNYQQLTSTIMSHGDNHYFTLNSLWMAYENKANYEFGLTYFNSHNCDFEDCHDNYQGNKNLYAMYLPSACREIYSMWSENSLSLSTTGWKATDLNYSFTLSHVEHIIVRYQYSAFGRNTYTVTRLLIDSIPTKHTASITGNTYFAGNSGMWQGILSSGTHTITVQHRSGGTYIHYSGKHYDRVTRAIDIVGCH